MNRPPFIRTVNVNAYARTLSDDSLRKTFEGMQANPKNYLPSFRRAVAAEVERRAAADRK